MNWSVLKKLLEKYYEGLTSLEEEEELYNILQHKDLPDEFHEDRLMMEGLHGDIPEPSPDLDARILASIDESEKERSINSAKYRLYAIVSVAASLLIILSFWFVLADNDRLKDTFDDPQLAYNETVRVLNLFSENLNAGMARMEDLSLISDARDKLELIPESRNVVTRELEALKYIENSVELLNPNNHVKPGEKK